MRIKSIYCDRGFWSAALRLALPIALQNLLTASFSLVDTFMVAKLGGTVLSAVGMAGQWSWLQNIVIFGIASATSLFVAQYWGIHDKEGIYRTTGIAAVSAAVFACIFAVSGFLFPGQIIRIFSRTPQIVEYGSAYLSIACWSYPAVALSLVFSSVLRSTEDVKLPVLVSLFTAIENGVLNYCLIFGVLGLPEMGVAGAAVATCISSWSGVVLLCLFSFGKKNMLFGPVKQMFFYTGARLLEFYRRAVPIILNESMWGLGTITINAIFSNMGDDYFAGVTILRTFENVAYVIAVGMCSACSVMVGKSIGAGKLQRAREDAVRFSAVMPLFSLVIGGCIMLFRHQLVGAFTSGGEYTATALAAAAGCLFIYGMDMPIRNIPYMMIVGIFRPGGNPKVGMLCDVLSLWGLSIPITAILAFIVKLPFLTVFLLMYLLEDIPKTAMCLYFFLSGKWIRPVTEEGQQALVEMQKEKFL